MQLDIFAKVAPLLRVRKPNIDCDATIDFLNKYDSGEWIYPKVVQDALKISLFEVYEIMELCVDEKLVDQYLSIYCPNCQRFSGMIYKTIIEVPEDLYCNHCDQEITTPIRYSIVIYRVK